MRASITRKVIDKNMLNSSAFGPVLRYLNSSSRNYVVITDMLVHECMRGKAADNFKSDFRHLAPFSKQLVALKTTPTILHLRARKKGLQKRLICRRQTREIKRGLQQTIENLNTRGPSERFQRFAEYSQRVFHGYRTNSNMMEAFLSEIIHSFPKDEISKIRKRLPVSQEFGRHLLELIMDIAVDLFDKEQPLPSLSAITYSFQYRYAIAYICLAIHWRQKGGIANAKAADIQNDPIDLTYVVYATYFDGIFTRDARVREIFEATRSIIAHLQILLRSSSNALEVRKTL
jgi:hypothetical protein